MKNLIIFLIILIEKIIAKSNILLFMSDDMSADSLSSRSDFFKSSTVFTSAITPFPVCNPSRASILTGIVS
jgi:arylsulfatase A-like enzyme